MARVRVSQALTQKRLEGCWNPIEHDGDAGSPPAAENPVRRQRQFELQIEVLPIMPRTPLSGRTLAVDLESFL